MAKTAGQMEDETQTDELETQVADDETQADEQTAGEQMAANEEPGADDEVVVAIDGESPTPEEQAEHEQAPEWVRELRRKNREDSKKIRELEEQLRTAQAGKTETNPVDPGPKPKLEDHDYDAEKYEAALEEWYGRKRKADEAAAQVEREKQAQTEAWNAKMSGYGKAKSELKVKDFEDAEAAVLATLSQTQQGIVVQGAKNPALVVYALGKNPKKLQELAAIKDPVEYAFAVARLETQLKVTTRKAAPPPETPVKGSAPSSGAVDSHLERLRAEAAKTGDYSKVTAYRRTKRSAK